MNETLDDARLRATEAQMRHALGLDSQTQTPKPDEQSPQSGPGHDRLSLHRPPRRFVKDGEVPVTVVRRTHPSDAAASITSPAANQLEAARQTIRSQAVATERAERALNDAQITIRDLRTKLAHERLAKDEAYQLVRRLEGERDTALTNVQEIRLELATERVGRERLEQELRKIREARQAAENKELLPRRPRGRPRKIVVEAVAPGAVPPGAIPPGAIPPGAIAAQGMLVQGVVEQDVALIPPPKRRGRPPKIVVEGAVPITLPKRRGRPPKIVVEAAEPVALPKKRGRPRKVVAVVTEPPRPRGRPRKVVVTEQAELGLATDKAPRRRGRPPKVREAKPVKWWTKGWKSKTG